VFELTGKTARELMTPRTEMIALAVDLTVEQAADAVAKAERSRYPVYAGFLDEIVGGVHAKDILRSTRETPGATVGSIMRPPVFVPGTREAGDVLADMKRLKVHMAVVLDEYGGTAGLVTIEDLVEEIVGPIEDGYDREYAAALDPCGARHDPVLDGAMPIPRFNTEYEAELSNQDYATLGGYVFGQLGRLPRPGDQLRAGPFTLEVLEVEQRRVKAVRLHRASVLAQH
jgi:CBS domain containing-hemolysin-like protein